MSQTKSPVTMGLAAVALVSTTVAVTLWLTRSTPAPVTSAPAGSATSEPSGLAAERGGPATVLPPGAQIQTLGDRENSSTPSSTGRDTTGVVINDRELTPDAVRELVSIYRYPPPKGRFWYDSTSGLYGAWGQEAAGYIHPGHNFGPLAPDASRGDTGVFINGRQINQTELLFFQILFNGQVQRGRVWLDGRTWDIGPEGSSNAVANLAVAIRQAQQRSRAGGVDWGWRDGSGAVAASDGNCTMMAVPGAPVYGSSGC